MEDWKENVDLSMSAFPAMRYPSVTNKMHLFFKHKDKYEAYLGVFSDEHGERLNKEMQVIEICFGKCLNKEMVAESIWSMKREKLCFEIICCV